MNQMPINNIIVLRIMYNWHNMIIDLHITLGKYLLVGISVLIHYR